MLKVGVLGAGHLGKIHLRLLKQSEKYELVGFYDENQENGAKIAKEFGYKQFHTIATLIHAVDVIDIVTPTLSHYKCLDNTFLLKNQFRILSLKRKKLLL
jgi:predicted dehydrogenase